MTLWNLRDDPPPDREAIEERIRLVLSAPAGEMIALNAPPYTHGRRSPRSAARAPPCWLPAG
jgi:hypothetical protein